MYGTYGRLRVHVFASNIAVIRAARRKLKRRCWHDPSYREGRKLFYRNMLEYHAAEQRLVREWRLL
jgi:hypothetical protein